jgi:hypothetical protein
MSMRRPIRHGIFLGLLLHALLFGVTAVRGEDVIQLGSAGLLHGLRTGDLQGSDLQSRFRDALSIKPTYFYRDPRAPVRLLDDGVQRDAMDFSVKTKLGGGLTSEGEVAFNSYNSQADKLSRDQRNRFLRFKLSGDAGFFGYGSEFRSAGQGFRPLSGGSTRPDREGTESWVDRKVGWLTMKALNTQYWNNVEADSRRPRTITSLNGTTASLAIPSLPTLSLSYMTGTAETGGGQMRGIQESTVQQYSATVYYWRPTWDISVTSMLMPSRDKLRPERETESSYHEVSFTYRPNDYVAITPYLSYSDERYKWTGTHSTNPMAMLSVSWSSLFNLLDFYSYSSYTRSKSNDGYMDTTSIMSINSFMYQLGEKKGERYLSFDVLYNRYSDAIYRESSYEDLLGRVMFTISVL